ncbi:MAG: hypothetical protein LBL47_03215, partial [Lactobacillus sp.]|nr:hypothetical protein [Lactobacillus sp.]
MRKIWKAIKNAVFLVGIAAIVLVYYAAKTAVFDPFSNGKFIPFLPSVDAGRYAESIDDIKNIDPLAYIFPKDGKAKGGRKGLIDADKIPKEQRGKQAV